MSDQPPKDPAAHHTFKVGDWDFDPVLKQLCGPGGQVVRLEDKIALVLETLCIHDGAPVSKDELIRAVWGGREVSEQTVPVAISKLRKTLGDRSQAPTMLETLPHRGYRLMVAPSDAVMQEAMAETPGFSGLSRVALVVSLLAIVLVGWAFFRTDAPSITTSASALKPGIILTINDVRPVLNSPEQTQRAIALSELASYFLSQVPDVLVIRHWWNLDAPDPTGGIYTRYGAETPVYSLKSTLLEQDGAATVTLSLSNPKTDEVIWSGLHIVDAGTGDYFTALGAMLDTLGVRGEITKLAATAAPSILQDERYWLGRYFAQLSNEGGARTAEKAWQAAALDHPEDPFITSAQQALLARWGIGKATAIDPVEDPAVDASSLGYVGLVDRAAIALFKEKDAARAMRLVDAALSVAPGDHYALSLLAEARLLAGDIEGGIEAYRKATRLAPFARSYKTRLATIEDQGD